MKRRESTGSTGRWSDAISEEDVVLGNGMLEGYERDDMWSYNWTDFFYTNEGLGLGSQAWNIGACHSFEDSTNIPIQFQITIIP